MREIKPTFFIIGAPKAGTTSLYYYLNKHPQVLMSSIKEPNFFAYEDLQADKLYYKDDSIGDEKSYLSLFTNKSNKEFKAVGEASVCYLFYHKSAQRIYNFNPEARILIMLRHPLERSWSHYLMDYKLNYVKDKFDDIALRRVNGHRNNQHYQQYVQLSLYASQIEAYLKVFPKHQIFFGLYDELKSNPQELFNKICRFLDIDTLPLAEKTAYNSAEVPRNDFIKSIYATDALRRGVKKLLGSQHSRKIKSILFKKPDLQPEMQTKETLNKLFADDLRKTEQLTGLNLQAWYETP